MDISGYHRAVRGHADLLLAELTSRDAGRFDTAGNVSPLLEALSIRLNVVDAPPSGCSVAGSCNHATQTITVVRAGKGRMRFTALHELGHLLGEDLDDFQDAVYGHGRKAGRPVEEDACDAFAATLLLPTEHLVASLDTHGRSARGLRDLINTSQASMEACAVAVAQRLASPGYVLLVERVGTTRFAARSGDVFPIARGTDQSGRGLRPVLTGTPSLRGRGALAFASGSGTHELYLDSVEHDGLVLAVACESDPDWPQLQTPATPNVTATGVEAHCSECGVDFTGWRVCDVCGEPRHQTCGRCGCETATVRGERLCHTCFSMLPPKAFAGFAESCVSCTG
ncbi:hypothetical protein acdb102_21550 [Acidothermaceae bacterium B102]|nr:hypothetical protein acdb102_21550 [Acidothermaceae bacterium B102]